MENDFLIKTQPYYLPIKNEEELFSAGYQARLPIMLKGPTGCGKTRFVEYMAYSLKRPLITVSCHEDLFASDLLGRFLLKNDETLWVDGPLTQAVRMGAICYLDEIVEARKDTTVVLHPLADDRRLLSIDKKPEVLKAHPDFLLVISYNPGYQSVMKDLKQSTRQRFLSLEFTYPDPENEIKIIMAETNAPYDLSEKLVSLAGKIRRLRSEGLSEGAGTRLVIHAAKLVLLGINPKEACKSAMINPLTDDSGLIETMLDLVSDFF